jgi:hypothetical protein
VTLDAIIWQEWLWLNFPDFEKLLDLLENQRLITVTEHSALLDLAVQMKVNLLS